MITRERRIDAPALPHHAERMEPLPGFRALMPPQPVITEGPRPTSSAGSGLSWMQPNRVLIRFHASMPTEERLALLREAGVQVVDRLASGELVLEIGAELETATVCRTMAESRWVALCRPISVVAAARAKREVETPRLPLPTPDRMPARRRVERDTNREPTPRAA